MTINKVFVYGTLRKGAANECENYGGKHLGGCTFQGARMFELGWFPGIKLDPLNGGEIVGDVYEVDESIINRLDAYEGCRGLDNTSGLYARRKIELTGYGEVYTYEYNGHPDNRPVVESGDWLQYLQEKQNG